MSIETTFFAVVSANAGVIALIGSAPCRLYPGTIPQDAVMPAAAYQLAGGGPENVMTGNAPADNKRLQLDYYAATYAQADALAEAFRTALEEDSVVVVNGLGVRLIGFNPVEPFEPETKRFRVSHDYSIWASR